MAVYARGVKLYRERGMAALYHYSAEDGASTCRSTAHRAALWVILNRAGIAPERDMPGLIRRYNEAKGGINSETEGCHETITQASLIVARSFIAAQTDNTSVHELTSPHTAKAIGRALSESSSFLRPYTERLSCARSSGFWG